MESLVFSFIKEKLSKIYAQFTSKLSSLLGRTTLDEQTVKELEVLLLSADTGVQATREIIKRLQAEADGRPLHEVLRTILLDELQKAPSYIYDAQVILLVGINGSGKTTFAGKLAHHYAQKGKKVLLVAADTFRAAAPEQLRIWAERSGVALIEGKPGQDPSSVVFEGCQKFKDEHFDILIIDTAGRLQTKVNLMHELAKINRVVTKQVPDYRMKTLLTIDAMLGQNSFEQAHLFKECTAVDGIVLSKMDGTGKGGIVFAIANQLHIPVAYISYGEAIDHMMPFDATRYVAELVNERL